MYICLLFPQNGSTPLYVAAEYNHKKVAETLLAAGANIDLAREVRIFKFRKEFTDQQYGVHFT